MISILCISVKAAKDANEALSMLRAEFFHLIIAEIDLPDMDGFQLMWQIHSRFKLPVVCEFVYILYMA